MINPYQGEISLNRHVWLRRFGAVFALAGLVLVSGCEIRPLGQAPPAPPTTGIYKSENAGNTWIYLSPNKANLVIGDTSVFLADPKVPSVLYWTTPGLGVYRSWNSGNNWQRLNAGLAQQFASITDIVFAPSDTNTLFLVGNFDNIGRVVTGSNGGENWHSLYTELPSNSAITGIAVDYQNPKKLYAISTSRAFLISEDSGQTWKAVSWFTGDPVRILIHPQSPNMILVQETAGGLDLSTDQGLTWKSILPAGMTHAIYEIQFNPLINNSIFLATNVGAFSSTDFGAKWDYLTGYLPVQNPGVLAIAFHPTDAKVMYLTVGNNFYFTYNNGNSWEVRKLRTAAMGIINKSIIRLIVNQTNPDIIYAGVTN